MLGKLFSKFSKKKNKTDFGIFCIEVKKIQTSRDINDIFNLIKDLDSKTSDIEEWFQRFQNYKDEDKENIIAQNVDLVDNSILKIEDKFKQIENDLYEIYLKFINEYNIELQKKSRPTKKILKKESGFRKILNEIGDIENPNIRDFGDYKFQHPDHKKYFHYVEDAYRLRLIGSVLGRGIYLLDTYKNYFIAIKNNKRYNDIDRSKIKFYNFY